MDLSELKGIISLMQKSDLTELEIEIQDLKLRLARPGATSLPVGNVIKSEVAQQQITSQVQPVAPSSPAPKDDGLHPFDSPMVGTFYRASGPGQKPYIEVGQQVGTGDTICIIEAMKLMNEIEAEIGGVVKQIFVENGQAVEFGQPLISIE